MRATVSDFKIAETILKQLCRNKGYKFVNVNIDFETPSEDCIFIEKKPEHVIHTIYLIVSKYIEMSGKIFTNPLLNTTEQSNFFITLANLLRGYIYDANSFSDFLEELTLQHLYQRPLIWIMMKDIICPIFKVQLKNVKIVTGVNPYVDIAKFYKEGEVQNGRMDNYEFIFVNEITNHAVQNAFLLVEVLKAHKLDPITVLKEIFESDLYDKFYGLLNLSFDDSTKIEEFNKTLALLTGINLQDFLNKRAQSLKNIKTAQSAGKPETAMQWWYLGLTESLLEPVRGYDWTSHSIDKKYEDFWNKVEMIKKQKIAKGKEPGITFNELLRLKDNDIKDCKVDTNVTLQELLSSRRIW